LFMAFQKSHTTLTYLLLISSVKQTSDELSLLSQGYENDMDL